ncbi:MAG: S8/S53 family peptidase, partial [Myxococcales bacterium]|nr:S8/S53 family peptidase [Myxococcales bacterium]
LSDFVLPVELLVTGDLGASETEGFAFPLESRVVRDSTGRGTVPDELTVLLLEAATTTDAEDLAFDVGAVIVGGSGLLDLYQLRFPTPADALAGRATLETHALVEAVRPFTIDEDVPFLAPSEWTSPVTPVSLPFGTAPILFDAAALAEQRATHEAIGLPAVWDQITGEHPTTKVLVVDEGIYTPHSQLTNADLFTPLHRRNPGLSSRDAWTVLDAGGSPVTHGTHVAGLACGHGNDATGTLGAAWGCGLAVYDAITPNGMTIDKARVATILQSMGSSQPIVVNISAGTNISCADAASTGFSDIDPATLEWKRLFRRFPNVVFVTAAGNCGLPMINGLGAFTTMPAALATEMANVVTVGSVDTTLPVSTEGTRQLDVTSNLGDDVTIAAPGRLLWSSAHSCFTPACDEGYAQFSGTSMAAPLVTGLVSLMQASNPSASPARIKACLAGSGTADPVEGLAAGMVDAEAALACIASCSEGDSMDVPGVGTAWCVPAGTFVMGCVPGRDDVDEPCPASELPQRHVSITRGFWMLEAELSGTAYGTLHTDPTYTIACFDQDVCPVLTTWTDATAVADALSTLQGLPVCGPSPSPAC